MTRLEQLTRYLLDEDPRYAHVSIPETIGEQRLLLRALLNVRPPKAVSEEFLRLQNEELQDQLASKGIVQLDEAIKNGTCSLVGETGQRMVEWQGDITRLKVDAIVNAANSRLLGCFVPLHRCIDNAIHSAAGVQLRLACAEIVREAQTCNEVFEEPTGCARLTAGFNLPSKYVLHTVGPIVSGPKPLGFQEEQLASCYRSCMEVASANQLVSIAFCCISTGEFRFPNALACDIAVRTVQEYLTSHPESSIKTVVFNTFKDADHDLYQDALG